MAETIIINSNAVDEYRQLLHLLGPPGDGEQISTLVFDGKAVPFKHAENDDADFKRCAYRAAFGHEADEATIDDWVLNRG